MKLKVDAWQNNIGWEKGILTEYIRFFSERENLPIQTSKLTRLRRQLSDGFYVLSKEEEAVSSLSITIQKMMHRYVGHRDMDYTDTNSRKFRQKFNALTKDYQASLDLRKSHSDNFIVVEEHILTVAESLQSEEIKKELKTLYNRPLSEYIKKIDEPRLFAPGREQMSSDLGQVKIHPKETTSHSTHSLLNDQDPSHWKPNPQDPSLPEEEEEKGSVSIESP